MKKYSHKNPFMHSIHIRCTENQIRQHLNNRHSTSPVQSQQHCHKILNKILNQVTPCHIHTTPSWELQPIENQSNDMQESNSQNLGISNTSEQFRATHVHFTSITSWSLQISTNWRYPFHIFNKSYKLKIRNYPTIRFHHQIIKHRK